jgi:hypothetical protein
MVHPGFQNLINSSTYPRPASYTQSLAHTLARAFVLCPAAHAKHAVDPMFGMYAPCGQGSQAPAAAKCPGSYSRQAKPVSHKPAVAP